jgi:hypothetical protein
MAGRAFGTGPPRFRPVSESGDYRGASLFVWPGVDAGRSFAPTMPRLEDWHHAYFYVRGAPSSKPALDRDQGRRHPILHAQFGQDPLDMLFNRPWTRPLNNPDLPICLTLRYPIQNLRSTMS